jgi:hypothetical protein
LTFWRRTIVVRVRPQTEWSLSTANPTPTASLFFDTCFCPNVFSLNVIEGFFSRFQKRFPNMFWWVSLS